MRQAPARIPNIVIASLLLALLAATLLAALALTGPSWSPTASYTNSTLNCSWTPSGDTIAQNITLLRNSALFNTTYENATLGPLSESIQVTAGDTTKGDVWTCRITLDNGTTTITSETDITILNSPPTTEGIGAGVFWNGADVGYLFTVLEDTTYLIDVNATDADGDALRYLLSEEFCARIDADTGTYTCTPTQAYIIGNLPTVVNVSFMATDNQNPAGRNVGFNITPVNDAPTTSLANQATPVNVTLSYTFTVTDEESSFPITTQLIAPAEIQGKVNITRLNADGTSVRFTYNGTNPDFNDIGVWNITINLTDNSSTLGTNDSRSALHNFTLNITAVGRRPYFTGTTATIPAVNGIYELLQGQAITINISANDPDANSTLTFLDDTSRFEIVTLKADANTSDALAGIIFTPTNADVGRYNVTITVRDQESITNTTVLQFNVTNVNDAPTINEVSGSAANTQGNTNATNLTAYANTLFTYDMNATDPDLQHGDVLAFSDNTTLFAINTTTGRVRFTPSASDIGGPYHINITAIDSGGLRAERTILLTVKANSPPRFNPALPELLCTTKAQCVLDLDDYAEDPEEPDDSIVLYSIAFIGANLTSFSHSNMTGLINFTTLKTDVANYTVNVTIEDEYGATNWSLMTIRINNTPEAPDLTRYNLTSLRIVETHTAQYELQAADDDLLIAGISGDAVNFTVNLSLPHTMALLPSTGETARALLSFTPGLGTAGNYTILINATDRFNLSSTRVVAIEILSKMPSPNITNITPWGVDNGSYALQTTWASTQLPQFTDRIADVRFDENTAVTFNMTIVDTRPLTYRWTINGTEVGTGSSYTRNFDFFSAGRHIVTLNVSNDRLEHSTFTWNLTVRNVNRPPEKKNDLKTPIEVNLSALEYHYFTLQENTKFYDPDDDLNSNGENDVAERTTMTFGTNSSCDVAGIRITGDNLTLTARSIGTCDVLFFATDAGGATLGGNVVTINVTEITNDTTETPTSSAGGGGSSSTTFIPITRKLETPRAFSLIAPKLVTIYSNDTLEIPIIVNNTWNGSLTMVRLDVRANATGVNTSLDIDMFEDIPQGETREVMLRVENYRLGSSYEVQVSANVSDPRYSDEALILLNSIEQSQEGEEYDVKVTFANDLLNEHSECQELNEVLQQAEQHMAQGNVGEATKLVESVISGCKYLVSMEQRVQEKPGRINPIINIDDLSVKAIMMGVLAFVVLSSVAFLIYYHYSHKPEDDI